jgi:Polyketide cyclase / dehydrase and lipid transport
VSHLSTTLSVAAPPEALYDTIADPTRNPEWQSLLLEMGPIAGRVGSIGSGFVGIYRVLGRKLEARFVVTAAERPSLYQVRGTTTGGWARWTTLVSRDGDGSRVVATLEYELPGEVVGSLFGLLAGRRIERELRQSYDRLKRIAEAEAEATSGAARSPVPSLPAEATPG